VLADEPRAVCGERDVILEDERLQAAVAGERHLLVVVDRPPEHIGRAVDVEVDEALDGADRGRRRREHPALGASGPVERPERGQPGRAARRQRDELAPRGAGSARRGRVVAAATREAPTEEARSYHRNLPGADLMSVRSPPDPRASVAPRATAVKVDGVGKGIDGGT